MTALSDALNEAVYQYGVLLADMDALLRHAKPDELDVKDALICRGVLADPSLGLIREELDNLIGDALGRYKTTIQGVGVVERHPRKDPAKVIDDEGLWRAVLDTRILDPGTGEVLPQPEVIKLAYGQRSKETGEIRLTGASKTKLVELGIDPDDYFSEPATRPGWTLRVI